MLDHLVVSGTEDEIANCLRDLLDRGLDELLVMVVEIEDSAVETHRLVELIGTM